ncbi:MAG: hypothetical protein ACLFVR_08665 [Thiohalospira sp.]
MKKIYALTDYKGYFGSKYKSIPYRSGFDQNLIIKLFHKKGFSIEFVKMSQVKNLNSIENLPFIYTSSEDVGLHYKSFIEDVVLFIKSKGGIVIPDYEYLRANNNKTFMEFFRKSNDNRAVNSLKSWEFGTYEEMLDRKNEFTFPIVVKKPGGAMGKGVFLANNEAELLKIVKSISRTRYLKEEIKDFLRGKKHRGYKLESKFRKKFILQEFIPNLINDWKVYVFGNKYFVFYRPVFKKRKFKASGGGYENYYYGMNAKIPDGLLGFSREVFSQFNVPHMAMDIAFDGKKFHLIEFQFVYFGTAGILYSKEYFELQNKKWQIKLNNLNQEECFVLSIINYLNNQ